MVGAFSSLATGNCFFDRVSIVEKPGFLLLWRWDRRLRRARKGMTPAEVERKLGRPSREIDGGGTIIWSYDLRRFGGTLYSIRVAFAEGRVCQSYTGMELDK